MKKIILLSIVFFSMLISCQKQSNHNDASQDAIKKADSIKNKVITTYKNSTAYQGTYKGMLPCADCEGIETFIILNENATYCIKSKYIGKGNRIFEQKGTFNWNKQGNIISFEGIQNAPNKYEIGKNTLTQLDNSGNKISGALANQFIFRKQSKNSDTSALEEEKPAVNLNNRMEAQTIIRKGNPAVGKYTLAETKWKLIALNGKAITQKKKMDLTLKLNSKDGKFSAYAGCNTLGGNYFMKSAFALSFSDIMSTMMACHDMKTERSFSKMLSKVDIYEINGNILQLKDVKKVTLAIFEVAQ